MQSADYRIVSRMPFGDASIILLLHRIYHRTQISVHVHPSTGHRCAWSRFHDRPTL